MTVRPDIEPLLDLLDTAEGKDAWEIELACYEAAATIRELLAEIDGLQHPPRPMTSFWDQLTPEQRAHFTSYELDSAANVGC